MTVSLRLGPLLRHVGPTTATVWVETDAPCRVQVLVDGRTTATARTFTVHGHHYAVCEIEGLAPGTASPYEVFLDGDRVWPDPTSSLPPSELRTTDPGSPTRLLYGSCHMPTGDTPQGVVDHGPDMLRATARRLAEETPEGNLLLLLIGDQVYADEVGEPMREHLRQARGTDHSSPDDEVVSYDEYAELYRQAWNDPQVRWLLSTVPTLMVFDDHDVRDDWNTSAAWRRAMDEVPWWPERVTHGLGAYWVYQHLGNLSPEEREKDPWWNRVREREGEAGDVVDEFAWRAHEDPSSYRWSHRVDVGPVRILMTDTRCARALGEDDPSDGSRSILGPEGHEWVDEHLTGGPDHVVVVSTVPVLLPPAVHHLEAWNEAVCAGAWGEKMRAPAERLRQGLDLEHWGAFQYSFTRLTETLLEVARGERGPAPATVLLLSGDVHFSYLARARPCEGQELSSRVTQLVSSPLCNRMPSNLRRTAWLSTTWPFHLAGRVMTRLARIAPPALRWALEGRPYFGNTIGEVFLRGREAEARWYHCSNGGPYAVPGVRFSTSL